MGLDDILATGLRIIDKVIVDPVAKEEAKIKLLELQQTGELKLEEFDVKREEIAVQDKDSARKMQIETHSNVPTFLAGFTIIGFFSVVIFILTGTLSLTGEQGILVGTIVGYVSSKADQVLSYYFGSSSSSRAKDNTIKTMIGNMND